MLVVTEVPLSETVLGQVVCPKRRGHPKARRQLIVQNCLRGASGLALATASCQSRGAASIPKVLVQEGLQTCLRRRPRLVIFATQRVDCLPYGVEVVMPTI